MTHISTLLSRGLQVTVAILHPMGHIILQQSLQTNNQVVNLKPYQATFKPHPLSPTFNIKHTPHMDVKNTVNINTPTRDVKESQTTNSSTPVDVVEEVPHKPPSLLSKG